MLCFYCTQTNTKLQSEFSREFLKTIFAQKFAAPSKCRPVRPAPPHSLATPLRITTPPEKDRATAIGNMHKNCKDWTCGFGDMLANRQTDTQTYSSHTCTLPYWRRDNNRERKCADTIGTVQFYQTALGNCYGLKLPKC